LRGDAAKKKRKWILIFIAKSKKQRAFVFDKGLLLFVQTYFVVFLKRPPPLPWTEKRPKMLLKKKVKAVGGWFK
jgi:hypothetical protein